MVYVHVPFCGSFCTYCDFYSELECGAGSFESYVNELCGEIESRRSEIRGTQAVNTLYVGGGTPSLLPLPCLERISSAVKSCVDGDFEEFTVEVNPEDIVTGGPDYVRGLMAAGVDRVSMGVQSLDDSILGWMNRRHTAAGALEAFSILRDSSVGNVSVDVIFGISHLTDEMLESTLRKVTELRPEHISAYQLSVEGGSALASMVADGHYREASDEQCRCQYGIICRRLREAGYLHYEISNWALPGFEARHNSAYWDRKPYVGVGPGAHSLKIEDGLQTRSWNSAELSGWKSSSEQLTEEEVREEEVMLGLRTLKGWNGRVLSEEEWFVSDGIISDMLSRM